MINKHTKCMEGDASADRVVGTELFVSIEEGVLELLREPLSAS